MEIHNNDNQGKLPGFYDFALYMNRYFSEIDHSDDGYLHEKFDDNLGSKFKNLKFLRIQPKF